MRSIDNNAQANIAATTAGFFLKGGKYLLVVTATWGGGNVVLQRLHNDGATWVPVHTALTANGIANVDIAYGQYRWAVTTATAVYATADRVPGE